MMRHIQKREGAACIDKQAGFSLIEMMISIALGLMIIASLVGVLTSNARNSKTNDRTAELQANGRYALDTLRRELRQAGFRGYTWAVPTLPTAALNVGGLTECGGAASGFISNLRQGVWGSNDSNPYSANCIGAAYKRGDVMVLRRVSGNNVLDANLTANTIYLRSTYAVGMLFQGTVVPTSVAGAPIGNFPLVTHVYYIGGDDVDANIPALRRVALFTDGTLQDEMVVSGIEQLQVQYGRLTTDGNTRYYNANSISGASTTQDKTDWEDVKSVRIWILSRNSKAETGYSNTETYSMGDVNYTVNDGFRRQLFTAVVHLRN